MLHFWIGKFQFNIDKDFQMRYHASLKLKELQFCQLLKFEICDENKHFGLKFTFYHAWAKGKIFFQIPNFESQQIHNPLSCKDV